MVVGRSSSWLRRPAALLQVIASSHARGHLLQDCQVRFRIAVLQEFLYADRRESCHDGRISPLIRKFDGGAASYPAEFELTLWDGVSVIVTFYVFVRPESEQNSSYPT